MKKFIIRLLIFLIPVVIFIGLWEYGLSTIPNSYSFKRAQLEAQAPQIKVLVLGPSLALRGVNPDFFCMKGYNVANVQQSLFYDTRITLRYLDKMTSLKVVLICIAYPSLWGELYGGDAGFRDYFYADYWGIRYPEIKWYDIHIYSKILHYGNDRAWQFALRGFHVDLAKGYHTNGWAIRGEKNVVINDSAGNAFITEYKKNFSLDNFDKNINDLKVMLAELNKRNISAVFYSPPVTPENYKFMKESRWKAIDSVISVLCATYHCKWYDYHKDPRFIHDDFRNASHLNIDGSTKFSIIINEDILKQYCIQDSINTNLKK